ncbi:Poxvirus A22-like protein [Paramecium bursaria Chlorella virus NYs1]|uniref:Poxvirus A22-like protein n=1 Tax=Paramecium bursaria Chlorella virus NYs1 TaxID=83442 RepID=M1I377_9PHYC|nr:Poxvirus A22-like protein [Paramecium bursaria Chlorella virus NYs1]AGE54848.1 Poxvirus A22-like protein [Paramecium bursaria Chlorella virus MA1D]AGE58702.1 Poxvirus A22-like protein [Paramecium bursaria Chlorella virus NYs1]
MSGTVIGIDPGTKNLALCMIDELKILDWNVINISPDPKGITDSLDKINFPEWIKNAEDIVIERQPAKNPRAVRIQHYLELYVAINGGRVMTVDAKHKLSYASSTEWWTKRNILNWTYNERKKLSIETVDTFLKSTDQDPKFVELFEKSKKKDDLADSLLTALAFLNNIKPQLNDDRKPAAIRNIKAVRPSLAQMKSGNYTQGGLKFLAKGLIGSFDTFETGGEQINGFYRSCYKHFGTLDNAFIQLGGK